MDLKEWHRLHALYVFNQEPPEPYTPFYQSNHDSELWHNNAVYFYILDQLPREFRDLIKNVDFTLEDIFRCIFLIGEKRTLEGMREIIRSLQRNELTNPIFIRYKSHRPNRLFS